MSLAVLAYNLTRVMNIVGIGPLIAAIRELLRLCELTTAIRSAWNAIKASRKLFSAKTCESAHRIGVINSVEVSASVS